MEKLVRDGKVAVLVSDGWGAGFHSWGAPVEAIFDPALVDMIVNEQIQLQHLHSMCRHCFIPVSTT